MAKRVADAQIQRETYDSNESDDDVTPSTKVASSAVMNRRKIAMPKRRMAFKPFGSAKSDETKQASSFSFLNRADGTGEAQVDNSPTTESNSRLKALNLQFKAKVDDLVLGKPLADLRPLFTRYELYIKNILEAPVKSIENPTQTKGNDAKPAKVEDVQKSSDSSSEDEVKVEGPKFTIDAKPPISDSVFSFGPKKENRKKDESDSENDIEIKGPEFKFSGTVSSDVFKLNPSTDKNEKKTETNAKPFSFSSATSTTEQTKSKNPLSLTEATKTNVDNNSKAEASFTFGTKHAADSQNNKPSFVFGQAAAKPSLEKSSFTFGSTTIEKKMTKTQPLTQNLKSLVIAMIQTHLFPFPYPVRIHLMHLSHLLVLGSQTLPKTKLQNRYFRLVQQHHRPKKLVRKMTTTTLKNLPLSLPSI